MVRTPENIGHLYQFKIETVKPGLKKARNASQFSKR